MKTVICKKSRKSGFTYAYEVYETTAGGVFTARVIRFNGKAIETPMTWSEPADTADDACKNACTEWMIREGYLNADGSAKAKDRPFDHTILGFYGACGYRSY